ncbi:MAG: ATP-binding protein [Clostridia bacterium]
MNNSDFQKILQEYEKRHIQEVKALEERKSKIYKEIPKIKEIDEELTDFSLITIKGILNNKNDAIKALNDKFDTLKLEKAKLLKEAGFPKDFLSMHYTCPLCKDSGYISQDGLTVMCSCLQQKILDAKYNDSNVSTAKNQTFETFDLNLYSDVANKEKYNSTISPRKNMENIKKVTLNFVDNFDDENVKNLLFSGGTGLGKTYLSNCIVSSLLNKGKTVIYQTAPVMLDKLIAEMFDKNNVSNSFSENLLTADLLVIDDLGTETMNSLKFSELYKIINTRLLNQNNKVTKTIISTNLSLQQLFETYDERLVSRFVGHYDIFKFFGEDIRFKH